MKSNHKMEDDLRNAKCKTTKKVNNGKRKKMKMTNKNYKYKLKTK